MKKIATSIISIIFILIIIILTVLSTLGLETDKFNKLISDKVSNTKNINLEIKTIKFKINPKDLSLFLETQNPKITYRDLSLPVKNIKAYIDFFSLFTKNLKIKKTSLFLEELNVSQLNELSIILKPSNFKSLLNNKIKEGKLISEIDVFLSNEGKFKDFIAKGKIKGLKVELSSDLKLTNTDLSFFADKNDVLIKNIFGDLEGIRISDGDIKLNFENGMKLKSNFNSKLNLDKKILSQYSDVLKNNKILSNLNLLNGNLTNTLLIDLDRTYKVIDYNFNISGKIEKGEYEFSNPINNGILSQEIKLIHFTDLQIATILKPKKINFKADGKYSFDKLDFLNVNLENNFYNDKTYLKLNLEYKNSVDIFLINYEKPKNT